MDTAHDEDFLFEDLVEEGYDESQAWEIALLEGGIE